MTFATKPIAVNAISKVRFSNFFISFGANTSPNKVAAAGKKPTIGVKILISVEDSISGKTVFKFHLTK